MMKPSQILAELAESPPLRLGSLPKTFGMYALWDHSGAIRYIGCTPKATEGFDIRVGNKHVTGSEGRSHKFSHAYCVGRMWRFQDHLHPTICGSEQVESDAKLAKRLRTLFIREYCRVTLVEVPRIPERDYFGYLTGLEFDTKSLAPNDMKLWDGNKFIVGAEPTDLVEELLLRHPELREPCERQASIYRRYVLSPG